uniref:F-box domain-containing protein n=1 Tax=Arundo donax TaxID=35708 RepID=A0A0A9AAY2_ARUDO
MEPNRRHKRKREPHAAPSRTTIASLDDDALAEILLRLPSLATLARAALACARWRSLATSRDFLRRFRALHSPPLLGCFVSFMSSVGAAFHRAQICSDRDLAAAGRGGDFFLTGLEDERQWRIRDCHHGLLLLTSVDDFALLNPVSRRLIKISSRRPIASYEFKNRFSFHCCLLPAYGGDDVQMASFRLVALEYRSYNGQQVCAHVYSSGTGEWRTHPWAPPSIEPPPPHWNRDESSYPSMHSAGRIYWKYQKGDVLLSLDTAPGGSMEFSHVALPPVPELYRPQAPYVVGDSEGGACCLVCVVSDPPGGRKRTLQVWIRNEEARSWELQTKVNLSSMFACSGLNRHKVHQVCAVTMGVVLLSLDHGFECYRYAAFRLKNLYAALGARGKPKLPLEADFISCRELAAYPYLLAWPPLLQQSPHRCRKIPSRDTPSLVNCSHICV